MLAVMDSLAIFFKLLFYQLQNNNADIGSNGCRALTFLGSFTTAYSTWILVFMALERFLAVRFPLKMNGSSERKIVGVLAIIGFIIALIYMPILWTYQMDVSANQSQCMPKAEYVYFMKNVFHWIGATVYGFVPFILLTIFNVLIARQINVSLKVRSVMRNQQLLPMTTTCVDTSIQRQVNFMLLSATVAFVIFTFPICLYYVADAHWRTDHGYTMGAAVKYLCQQIAFVLCDATHAVNFYLYFLTARRFRHHFLRLVTCKNCYDIKSFCKRCDEHAANSNNNNDSEPDDQIL
nr:hypothetical protein BaRGS_034345 [Batillaria attramentaria]